MKFRTQSPTVKFFFYILLSTAALLHSGCFTAKRMDKWVAEKYRNDTAPEASRTFDDLVIRLGDSVMQTAPSKTEKIKRTVIPLLFYWHWDYTINTELGHSIAMKQLRNGMTKDMNHAALKRLLRGNTLELTVARFPRHFLLRNKGHLFYGLLFYSTRERTWLTPKWDHLVVDYRVLHGGKEIKKGTVTLRSVDQEKDKMALQSAKKMTWNYLDQYEANAQRLGRKAMEQIVSELQTGIVATQ